MLEEAVNKMKGEGDKPAHPTTVLNLGISVRIDSDYIPEENQRLRMYKRIAGALDQAMIDDVRSELHDRYGAPPESVQNLLAAGELRLRCEQLGIAQLDRKRTQVELPNPNGNKKQPIKAVRGDVAHPLCDTGGCGLGDTCARDRRPGCADEVGGPQLQARRAVYAAGCVSLAADGVEG